MYPTALGLLLFLLSLPAVAQKASYRLAHPVGWMHQLPVGEQPGWSKPSWVNLELNHANIWNVKFNMTDRRNGNIYGYKADFEQSSAILDMGGQIFPSLAFSVEVPYANRNGGFLDDFIDQFHELIGSDRFLRHLNEKFDNSFVVEKNSAQMLATERGSGVGSVKTKLKYWLWQWRNSGPGACECGLSLGTQIKFPTLARRTGMSSGSNDYTGTLNLGIPLFSESGIWLSTAVTKLGRNGTFTDWPRRDWAQMYELSMDIAVGPVWGFMLQARAESPLFEKGHVNFNYTAPTPEGREAERVASGWNSLMYWRGSQAIGPRWRWRAGHQVNLLIIEDWGIGKQDRRSDWLYVNNAPDVAFVSQIHIVF